MKSVTETKQFKADIKCVSCAYEFTSCKPNTIHCVPIYPYDLMMRSKIRKLDIVAKQTTPKSV